jgi:hypothetical protein
MSRAARSCRNATSNMGPCGPVPSLLHRHLPATPRRPHRRAGRPLDRPAPGRAGPPPRPRASPCRRSRPPPPAGLVRPRAGDPGRAATPAPAPGPGNAVGGGPRKPSPAPSARSARCWPPAVCCPRPAGGAAADAGGRVRLRQASGVELRLDGTETQVRRPRSHRAAGGRSSPASASKTPASPPSAATRTAAPCGPGRCGPAACTTRPPSRPRASPTCWPSILRVKVRVDEGYRGLATAFPEQLIAPPRKPPKDAPPRRWLPGGTPAPSSPQHGSAWNMRSLSTSSGVPCSAISAAGSRSARPTWRSQAWSRTGQPDAEQRPAEPVRQTRPNPNRAPSRKSLRGLVDSRGS